MCCSRKYPYLSHRRLFSLNPPPPPLRKCHFSVTLCSKNWAFETPLPLGISVNLPLGGHGYFLELHNSDTDSFSFYTDLSYRTMIRGFIKFLCRRSVGFFSGAFLVFLIKESNKRRRKQPGKLMAKSCLQPVNLPGAKALMNPLNDIVTWSQTKETFISHNQKKTTD